MKAFADLANLPEKQRIAIIGRAAESSIVGFFVDDEAAADRYIAGLLQRFAVRLIKRKANVLVKNTVFVRVGPKES